MSRYDTAEMVYKPNFVNFPKFKPTLSAQKKQLIFYYLGSYFRKFTKNEILNSWNHHVFYWDEKEHLILSLRLTSYSIFCDNPTGYNDRDIKGCSSYHDNIYFLYDFNTNKLAIQGYLIDRKHKKYETDDCIEDIDNFTDDDLSFILSRKMIDYDIRDQEIDDFLNKIKEEFPIHRFYNFKTNSYNDNYIAIGYLTKIDYKHSERKAILHITRYSSDTESLCEKKNDKYNIELRFLTKEKEIEHIKLKLIDNLDVKKKIYDTRKSKINDLKNKNKCAQNLINKHKVSIKEAESAINTLEKDIKDRIDLINKQEEDLKNTIIEDIKIL